TVHLEPGETVTVRYVNLYEDTYEVRTEYTGGTLKGSVTVPDGQTYPMDLGAAGAEVSRWIYIRPGEYLCHFTATGDTPVDLRVTYDIAVFHWEVILANGLGQGPALNLRLISPTI